MPFCCALCPGPTRCLETRPGISMFTHLSRPTRLLPARERRAHRPGPPNKRLKLTGDDRRKGNGVLCPSRNTDYRSPSLRRRPGRPQLKRDPLGGHMTLRRVTIARLVLFVSVLALCTMATTCFRTSGIVLTPSPSPAASMHARAIAITDSVARQHGLKPKRPWHYCAVRGAEGIPEAAWERGSLSLTACAERAQPSRMEIQIRCDGYWWNAKGKVIHHELPDALRATFGAESVTVTVDPK